MQISSAGMGWKNAAGQFGATVAMQDLFGERFWGAF